MENSLVQNRPSPKNEPDYINAYKQIVPSANRKNDGYDVSAVRTKSGQTGYAMLQEGLNRAKDDDFHRGKNFVPTSAVRKKM